MTKPAHLEPAYPEPSHPEPSYPEPSHPEPSHPLALRFEPAPRRSIAWLLPLLVALLLLLAVAGWLQLNDGQERDDAEQALINQTLSLDQLLHTAIEAEQQRAVLLAQRIAQEQVTADNFAASADVLAGLRGSWLSIGWQGEDGRERASATALTANRVPADDPLRRGLSAHLAVPVVDSAGSPHGALVVRYGLAALLTRETPWWIDRVYVVRLVDGFGEVLATTAAPGEPATGLLRRISFDPPFAGVYLELQQRVAAVPWYRSLPLTVVGGALALLVWATVLAYRQNRSVEQAEAAWRGEAAWRRAMEDALTVGLRARDLDGRLLYVNRRFCDLTGYAESELIGRAPPMPYWPPDQIDEAMQRHLRNMAGGAPAEGYQSRWCTRDGREVVVMLFETPLVDPAGVQVGWLGSVIDVTERERADERERQRNERAAYQARLMTLGEIAASLAHELNQPLAAIASYNAGLRNLLTVVEPTEPRDGHEAGDRCEPTHPLAPHGFTAPRDLRVLVALDNQAEQARRAGRIVERIRGFLSRRAPQQESCELGEIITQAAELVAPDLWRRGITLSLPARPALPALSPAGALPSAMSAQLVPGATAAASLTTPALPLSADPVLIEQVVVNLVRNAADAIAQEGAGRGAIEIAAGLQHQQAWFEVRDDGPGLAGRSIEQLATPFYSTRAEGMGLGLAICRSIIESHLGSLTAFDRPPPARGACLRVTLPLRVEVVA